MAIHLPKQAPFAAVLLLSFMPAIATTQSHVTHTTAKSPEPTGPTVLIDTTLGRLTCKLYSKESPETSANFLGLATGSKDWLDPATHQPVHGKPFYEGIALAGISDGITSGDRLGANKGLAGPPFPAEKNGLSFDRSGLLVMARNPPTAPGDKSILSSSSLFFVLSQPDLEYKDRGTIFGQCDPASLPVIEALSHALLTVDNHPAAPLAVNHITVLQPGEPAPALAANVPPASVTPQPAPMPVDPTPAPEPTGPTAVIDTTMGQITCRLFKETPIATANFIGLADGTKPWKSPATHVLVHGRHFYDGLAFSRVIPDFMIQNADMPSDPDGGGDIGFHFAVETVPGLTFDRPGRLAYANAGPNTNESEFFITEHPIHRLDGNYTIFGQCDDASIPIVQAIARAPRNAHNRPLKPVTVRRIVIQ